MVFPDLHLNVHNGVELYQLVSIVKYISSYNYEPLAGKEIHHKTDFHIISIFS